jgi:type VI secretion system protein ImpH
MRTSTRWVRATRRKDEPIQFRATRSFSFGASDVSEISYDEARDKFDIRVNFLGLYGPASPLPPNVTERIIESDENPSSLEDLLDLFNHRLTILLVPDLAPLPALHPV